ncbi:Dbp5p-like EIF4a-1-family RNA SFII helicase [Cryptosporidium ubiquitum]|uniref:RNA helicase n=1 Tax=Cryptosporidium ubiquitum TaxID=857276 RepID=A0A1J4MF16_9CRYT|nr:Dbp5p-like EIF4a-1-family RNA SFII helicase [Cryptosporidium ubiquitum]OII72830.1 Dbp5p-like EIF4a-1-family RNA SFII helicase [Cryptosporidium ubiquitum]
MSSEDSVINSSNSNGIETEENGEVANVDELKAYFRDISSSNSQSEGSKRFQDDEEGASKEDDIGKSDTEKDDLSDFKSSNNDHSIHQFRDVENSSSISVQTVDPKAQLYSAKDWSDLNLSPDLLKGIYNKGFNRPSKIQAAALPLIFSSPMNLIAQAHNGSGKTATFALAMLGKVDTKIIHPQCMCLCPTRELARQNQDVVNELGKFTGITTWLVVAQGDKYDKTIGSQIIICTPGKMQDFLKKRSFPTEFMKLMVIDEADEMIDHRNMMASQVGQIRKFFRQNLQILLFSATYHEEVRLFAEKIVPNANKINVKKEELTLNTIQQFYVICNDDADKLSFLSDLYACMSIGQSIIFVNTRKTAFSIAENMRKDGHAISVICGTQTNSGEKMDHEVRDQVMDSFRSGESKVLIATDVLSRGIDVPQVTLVINFDIPIRFNSTNSIGIGNDSLSTEVDNETYLHRIGRTGRFGLNGISINFILPHQLSLIQQIKDYYNCNIQLIEKDLENLEQILKSLRS